MEVLGNILDKIDSFVWGVPLIVLILAVGIYLSIRLGFCRSATCRRPLSLCSRMRKRDMVK